MQLELLKDAGDGALLILHQRLRQAFGSPPARIRLDPVSQLLLSMLGARTRGSVSLAAFDALRGFFDNWEALRDAPQMHVYSLIEKTTHAEDKAKRLQQALWGITKKCDRLNIDFLKDWDVENALAWLEQLPGVGRKTAAAILNFSTLERKALVIDTHHLRVLQRMKILAAHADTYNAYEFCMSRLPEEWGAGDFDDHHFFIKRLGQRFCTYGVAHCSSCPVRDMCTVGRRVSSLRYPLAAAHLPKRSSRLPALAADPQQVFSFGRPASGPTI